VISRYAELAIVAGWTHRNPGRNPFIVGVYCSLSIPAGLFRDIVRKGMPLLVNEFLWASGMAVMSQCYSTCGLDVVPAQNISGTMFNLASVTFLALGNSVGILMGQMLGANHTESEIRDANRRLVTVSVLSGVVFGSLMAAASGVFPLLYKTSEAVRLLASRMILVSAVMMPFNSYTNAAYFTLRSGGQTLVTFLFDSCFMWVLCVPLAFIFSRFIPIGILPLYALCQSTDLIKCILGGAMIRQGKWIQNLTL
jgi:Na+-driven multidrug efflux pump